jgi:hypothetical protein
MGAEQRVGVKRRVLRGGALPVGGGRISDGLVNLLSRDEVGLVIGADADERIVIR